MHGHIVVDTNILVDYLHPGACTSRRLADRVRVLFDSALIAKWTDVKLHIPAIAVVEAIGTLDKYRFCTWHGPVRKNPDVRLSAAAYKKARQAIHEAVTQRRFEQIEHEPCHVVLSSLVSQVNHIYQYRRQRQRRSAKEIKVRAPMGAADCMIASMAILLGSRVGFESVRLLTADQRLADVMTKCRQLTAWRAERLGLPPIAASVGLSWQPSMYPVAVNLRTARLKDLRAALGGWPLPTKPLRAMIPNQPFTAVEDAAIVSSWQNAATEYGLRNPDNLPFHPALQDIRIRVAADHGLDIPARVIFKRLLTLRKQKKLR